MALLVSCWFIIESVIIPGGLWKWFYLSFYIHPIFLFCCQIFLWLVLLKRAVLATLRFVLEVVSFPGSCACRFFRSCVINLFMHTEVTKYAEAVVEEVESVQNCSRNEIVDACVSLRKRQIVYKVQLLKCEEETVEELNRDICKNESPCSEAHEPLSLSSSSSSSSVNDLEMDESLQPASIALEAVTDHDQEFDPLYEIYEDRMKWFDLLSRERRCGISAMLSNRPSSYREEKARKRVLKSLESDIELVYVAQSCLSWEALHHQCRKIEFLASQGVFYDNNNVAGEFHNFLIILERFLEEERCHGDRVWSFIQGRSSFKSFLQVPNISGFSETKRDVTRAEATSAKEVLKVVEQCMKAYWEFVRADSKKSWCFKTPPWTYPSVEDPRDLKLIAELTKNLKEKEEQVKDVWGKKKKWFKRGVRPVEECQRMEVLCAMIDMKLIGRVLQMSMVSSSNLRWCQEKLQLIEVKEGTVFRAWPGPMFPP